MKRVNTLAKGLTALAATFFISHSALLVSQPLGGGFLENTVTAAARAALTPAQIQNFLPTRGAFTFPAPYNTRAFRLTNSDDCAGNDCVNYSGYSYWRNINNHTGMDTMLIVLGLDQTRGGKGPSLFQLNKTTGVIDNLGPLFPSSHRFSWATGEGWYFSATMPTMLYINDGPRIIRYDVITEAAETVVDLSDEIGEGYYLSQIHSSDNDRTHSATVRDDRSYRALGCMAYQENGKKYHFYPIERDFDECQVDRSGNWLLIKANLDGLNGEDNLIVDLRNGKERILRDRDGAGGHSDLGHGYMVAADNWATEANTWKIWDFSKPELEGVPVYSNKNWDTFAPAHLSHTNASSAKSAQEQYACGSSVNRGTGVHANEIVCFKLDGSGSSLVVAPTMTNLDASGGHNEYARYAKGNLDVTGQYFLWTSNMGGSRLDVFVVRVPDHLLTGGVNNDRPGTPAPPAGNGSTGVVIDPPGLPQITPPSAVLWQASRNVTTNGWRLVKTTGCNGCADAGSVSVQKITQGQASLEFTVPSTGPLFFAGFTQTQSVPTINQLALGLRLQNGIAEVREYGSYRADIRFSAGDRFGINVTTDTVSYTHNGVVFHSANRAATYPLYAGTSLLNIGATVENVLLSANPAN